jgi:hypothetical protein
LFIVVNLCATKLIYFGVFGIIFVKVCNRKKNGYLCRLISIKYL